MSEAANPPTTGFSSASKGDSGALALPRVFGRLLLLKLMARGGMGDVYLAATTGIEGAERACVVKTVRRDHIHDGSFLARFLDEARVQAQLNHPGVAQVLEASTDENGEPFTVVEYVEGRSLADVRQRAVQLGVKVGWADAVAMAIEMAQALSHVHGRADASGVPLGIVHRDLSPQNVMIGYAGEVKLIDFGTARGQNRRCHTVAGVVFAKPGYVAPEVARQQVGDGRIDIYALGVMLWELCKTARFLTGDPQKHLEDSADGKTVVPKVASFCGAPAELDEVIAKLTANAPEARYKNGSEGATDLARLLAQAPPGKDGERSVRGRVAALMKELWPREPSYSRAEFAKLLREARGLVKETQTPTSARAAELAKLHSDDPDVLPGTPYRLGSKLGEGASAAVYEAEHVGLGRKVALKILSPAHTSATDAIDRFRREARAVAGLSHPNLVALHDFGKSLDGRVFLAMELLTGETLEKRLAREGGMDWRDAALAGMQVCRALEAAHEAGLVHRDLKPANLFVTGGGSTGPIKLLDFGVAMALADVVTEDKERRQKGFAIFGTPEYMAPEQVAGDPVDGRCDVYALGAVLYELVTGSPVFDGPSAVVVMGKQLREQPEPPRVRAPKRGIPPALDSVILRALAKTPGDRFASAAAMREALESAIGAPERQQSRVKRLTRAVMLGGTVGVLGALAFTQVMGRASLASTPAMAEAAHAVPIDLGGGVPLPVPPTATPEPAPPALESAEKTAMHAAASSLPPLPGTRPSASGTPADPPHAKKLRTRLPGLETVSHKTSGSRK